MLMNVLRMDNDLTSEMERSLWREMELMRNRGWDVVLFQKGMGFLDSKESAPQVEALAMQKVNPE
jgi:hypothetical protein